MAARDKFLGGDQRYLRDVQYSDTSRLAARANLHAKYGTGTPAWFPWLASLIEWPSSGEVLEIGCGPGWLWVDAAMDLPSGLRLTLTDLSPGMVEAACARVKALRTFTAVRAEVLDAQRLPFADASFDVAVANHMLYHVPDPARAVAELARVLRPSGYLLAAANGPANMKELWEIRAEVFGQQPTDRTTQAFGSVTGRLILEAKFSQVKWHTYVDALRCTDSDDIVAYLTSSPPGEDADPQLLASLARAVRARFDSREGLFRITKDTGAFVAAGPAETWPRPQ